MEFPITQVSNELIYTICEKMDDPTLENFMKTSKFNYNLCYNEWKRRHQTHYGSGHILFTKQERYQLKQCLKDIYNDTLFSELININFMQYNITSYELRREMVYIRDNYDLDVIDIEREYGSEAAIDRGTEWDIDLFLKKTNNASKHYYYMLVDSIHSDESLFELTQVVEKLMTLITGEHNPICSNILRNTNKYQQLFDRFTVTH